MAESEEKKFVLEFIELYHSLPALWDIKSKDYSNRIVRDEQNQILLDKYKEKYPNADKKEMAKKINTLRTNYKRELKRVREIEKTGVGDYDDLQSPLYYFEALRFIDDVELPSRSRNTFQVRFIDNVELPSTSRSTFQIPTLDSMDVEKLINLIYGHKCLWDQSDPSYHLREVQRMAWRNVSQEMDISVDELKKKWRGLRDNFGKELKKLDNKISGPAADRKPDSKWPFFKLLLFLRSTMSRRELKSSVPDACEISDGEDTNSYTSSKCTFPSLTDPLLELEFQQTPKKQIKSPLKKQKKLKRSLPDEFDRRLLQIEEEKLRYCQQNANDPDTQFLMSLLPFLKDVPKHRKLIVRAKLQNVLLEEQNAINISTYGSDITTTLYE